MVLALGFGGALGALGMLLHMTFHSVTKPLLFFCAGNVQQQTGHDSLKKVPSGLLHVLPVSAPVFLLATLAVTGTPPFSLFQSEFMILRAGFAAQHTGSGALRRPAGLHLRGILPPHLRTGARSSTGRSAGEFCRWKTYPVIGLFAIVLAMGFWLPRPLYVLVEGAAKILAVQP